MTQSPRIVRPIGTMVVYDSARRILAVDLEIARRLGASCLEILPDWRKYPDPASLRTIATDAGFSVHSAHGCWGSQAIEAKRVDLGSLDPETSRASLSDLRRCVDWLADAGGRCLVVHPGGLSALSEEGTRREALSRSLAELAEHASGTGVVLCVENMPPGVHPGSSMADLASLVAELNRPEVALALDTGHAHLVSSPAIEARAAGGLLATTHVHDNDGRRDLHHPPGTGSIDWEAWVDALDEVDYAGPIMLECIRIIRDNPACLTDDLLAILAGLSGRA